MVFKWNVPGLYPVDAQTAGEELNRIYEKHGELEPADVVEESKDENAPLHDCFEWDDVKAAQNYRIYQAGKLIRCVVHVVEDEKTKDPIQTRAYVHVQNTYRPISVVIESKDMVDEMMETAMSELNSFRKKYSNLQALSRIFIEIDKINEKFKKGK